MWRPGSPAYEAAKANAYPFDLNRARALLQEAGVAQLVIAAGTEVDPAKQKQIYAQINDLILDESFAFVVSSSPQIMMTSSKVHGLQTTYHSSFSFTNAWLDA